MNPDDTLALIDGALEDWGTSPDAMRWTPEPAPEPATFYYTVTAATTACGADPTGTADSTAAIQAAVDAISSRWTAPRPGWYSIGPLRPLGAVVNVGGPQREWGGLTLSAVIYDEAAHYFAGIPHRQRRSRCRVCNPAGNPPPLAGKFKPGPKAARIRRRRKR